MVVVVVSGSTRTQESPLDEEISGVELETVKVWLSEFSLLWMLSVVIAILEVGKVDVRRVGESSPAGVVFSLQGVLNHELPHEKKPGQSMKQAERKKLGRHVRGVFVQTGIKIKKEPK